MRYKTTVLHHLVQVDAPKGDTILHRSHSIPCHPMSMAFDRNKKKNTSISCNGKCISFGLQPMECGKQDNLLSRKYISRCCVIFFWSNIRSLMYSQIWQYVNRASHSASIAQGITSSAAFRFYTLGMFHFTQSRYNHCHQSSIDSGVPKLMSIQGRGFPYLWGPQIYITPNPKPVAPMFQKVVPVGSSVVIDTTVVLIRTLPGALVLPTTSPGLLRMLRGLRSSAKLDSLKNNQCSYLPHNWINKARKN